MNLYLLCPMAPSMLKENKDHIQQGRINKTSMSQLPHYLLSCLCCQIITAIRTKMTIPRTTIMTNNEVSLSGQVHLLSVKKNKVFHNLMDGYLISWLT